MTQTHLNRNAEIRQIHREYEGFYQLGGGILLVVFGVVIGAMLFSGDSGYGTNIYTEILSVGLTIFVLNNLQDRRDKRNREQDLKAQLIRDAHSESNHVAIHAISELRAHGWLTGEDGLLSGKNFWRANLEGADLSDAHLEDIRLESANLKNAAFHEANLRGAHLNHSNLAKANFYRANAIKCDFFGAHMVATYLGHAVLSDTILWGVNLSGANLESADLQNANLWNANLKDAKLVDVNMKHTDLWKVNLQNAKLENAKFDTQTLLPDHKYWTPDTDMGRYTDPNHPDFWQPDWAKNSQEE